MVKELPAQTDYQDKMIGGIQKLGQRPTDYPISKSTGPKIEAYRVAWHGFLPNMEEESTIIIKWFENDENYEIIEQLLRIYPEYPLSKWDFHKVTTTDKSDTFEEKLPAFNEYIHWDYCDSL
ncbi:2648_t:CDS:2 [Gigaspora margarita]|uniref:2648_t:CDS:1 n=1 Tax=Gigaspora margarita TaxID=4874 RepID=A0ABN7UCK9_GIGMA|nr:2648_t:CDS:2 [Gigaspora margarita]